MKREEQIKFLEGAKERAAKRARDFAHDKKIQDAVRDYDHLLDRHKPKVVNA
ncbi:hypothetical protein [Terasakiella pusilla]|uniref:hypothetical protein n=1 Tax=Terasakiella pusilla TaxID=64973 RepID=UPI003AA7D352